MQVRHLPLRLPPELTMVYRSRHPAARHAERFTCPRCGAAPGQQCHSRNSTPCPWPHMGRVYQATAEAQRGHLTPSQQALAAMAAKDR